MHRNYLITVTLTLKFIVRLNLGIISNISASSFGDIGRHTDKMHDVNATNMKATILFMGISGFRHVERITSKCACCISLESY